MCMGTEKCTLQREWGRIATFLVRSFIARPTSAGGGGANKMMPCVPKEHLCQNEYLRLSLSHASLIGWTAHRRFTLLLRNLPILHCSACVTRRHAHPLKESSLNIYENCVTKVLSDKGKAVRDLWGRNKREFQHHRAPRKTIIFGSAHSGLASRKLRGPNLDCGEWGFGTIVNQWKPFAQRLNTGRFSDWIVGKERGSRHGSRIIESPYRDMRRNCMVSRR